MTRPNSTKAILNGSVLFLATAGLTGPALLTTYVHFGHTSPANVQSDGDHTIKVVNEAADLAYFGVRFCDNDTNDNGNVACNEQSHDNGFTVTFEFDSTNSTAVPGEDFDFWDPDANGGSGGVIALSSDQFEVVVPYDPSEEEPPSGFSVWIKFYVNTTGTELPWENVRFFIQGIAHSGNGSGSTVPIIGWNDTAEVLIEDNP